MPTPLSRKSSLFAFLCFFLTSVPIWANSGASDEPSLEYGEVIHELTELDVGVKLPPATTVTKNQLLFPTLTPRYNYPVKAILEVIVASDGWIKSAKVLQTNEKDFGDDAVDATQYWKVIPAEIDGKPVACRTAVIITAKYRDGAKYRHIDSGVWFVQPPPKNKK